MTSKSGLTAKKQGMILAELTSFAVNATNRLKTLAKSQNRNTAKREANNRVFIARFQFYQKNYENNGSFVNYYKEQQLNERN